MLKYLNFNLFYILFHKLNITEYNKNNTEFY